MGRKVRRRRSISSLHRVVIANNRRFDVGARDHRGGPIGGANPGVDI